MYRKVAAVWVSLAIMVSSIVILVEIADRVEAPTTLYVGGGGPGNYSKIQWAIDNASDGDTVFVYNGTYYEHLSVNKTISLIGENKENTTIDGGEIGIVVNVSADWVNITGFTITGSGMDSEEAGIKLTDVQNNRIINNNVSLNYWSKGIYLINSDKNNITSNIVSDNYFGIIIFYSNDNILTDNNVFSNAGHGIYLYSSHGHKILYNNASSNRDYGILLSSSNGNNITGSIAFSNRESGIGISASNWNNITINNASYNQKAGIYLGGGEGNGILSNEINFNENYGIHLSSTRMSRIVSNVILRNGILLGGNALEDWTTHYIDTSNTVNGKPLQYWKNQTGGNVPLGAGQVILANCSNVKIENQKLTYTTVGIRLGFSSDNFISDNNVSNNLRGIILDYSNGNNITGNTASFIELEGIRISISDANNIIKNKVSNCNTGIKSRWSDDIDLTGNNVSHNNLGIFIDNSINNNIWDNNIFSNIEGFYLKASSNGIIYHNNIMGNSNQAFDNDNNQWDNGYPSGGNYWSDYNGIDLNSTPTQNVPPSDGIGDTPYEVDSNTEDNYPLMNPIGNFIFLYEGWNLISIPIISLNTNLDTIFSSITDSYDSVQWYNNNDANDPWKHNHTSKKPYLNDFNNLNHEKGFWIHITKPRGVLYEYPGTQPTSNQTIPLHPGWNMVGYPSLKSHNRTTGLNNLTFDTHVDCIQWYDAATKTWHFMGPDDSFAPGRGYWVHSKVDAEWEVPL